MNTPYNVFITSVVCKELKNVEMATIGWSGMSEGKNDPYVKFTFGAWYVKTQYINDAGEEAHWYDQHFTFKTSSAAMAVQELKIEVWDYNTLKDTFIGDCKVSLQNIAESKEQKEQDIIVDIVDGKKQKTGMVSVRIRLEPDIEAMEAQRCAEKSLREAEQEAIDFAMKDAKTFEGFIVIREVSCEGLSNVEMKEKSNPFFELKFAHHPLQVVQPKIGTGSIAQWDELYLKFDANETEMRIEFLDFFVKHYKSHGDHFFVGDASIPLYDLLEQVGRRVQKTVDIKNSKNKRSGKLTFIVSAHRYDATKAASIFGTTKNVKYVMNEEVVPVSTERIILPRYKLQITDKFIASMKQKLTAQNTYVAPKVEAYGLVTKILTATDDLNVEIREEAAMKKMGTKGNVDRIVPTGHARSIRRIGIWQGDGITYFLTSSSDQTTRIFDFDSGEYLRTLKGHDGPVLCVAASPDGDLKNCLVVTGGDDCTVRVYSMMSGRQRLCLSGHASKVVAVCFSDPKYTVGGKYVIISLDQTGEIRIWEKEKGELLRILNATSPVTIHQLPDYENCGH